MRSAALAVVLAGCAGLAPGLAEAPDAEPAELTGQTFGVPGEVMEYEVQLRGMTIGHVVVSVGQPGVVDGHRAIIVSSSAEAAGVASLLGDARWELTTTLDMATGLPLHEIDEKWIELKGKPAKHDREERDAADGSYNLHAAASALRGWKSQSSQHASLDVRADQFHADVEVWEAAHEYLASAKQPAVRYDGVALDRPFSVWISDDEARVPLLLRRQTKLGIATVELVRYDPPSDVR
jgi:hypothetical protein